MSLSQARPLSFFLSLSPPFPFCSLFLPPSVFLSLQVHVPNNCEFGTRGEVEVAEFDGLFVHDPEELKKDPHTCFFESQHHAHGSLWTPNYNNCFTCSCQVGLFKLQPLGRRYSYAFN